EVLFLFLVFLFELRFSSCSLKRFEFQGERDQHISPKKHTEEKTKELIGRRSLVISFPPQNTII
ncbi:hypothetical protein IscW_ISCW011094, partial [Ixodes scapularis]